MFILIKRQTPFLFNRTTAETCMLKTECQGIKVFHPAGSKSIQTGFADILLNQHSDSLSGQLLWISNKEKLRRYATLVQI